MRNRGDPGASGPVDRASSFTRLTCESTSESRCRGAGATEASQPSPAPPPSPFEYRGGGIISGGHNFVGTFRL